MSTLLVLSREQILERLALYAVKQARKEDNAGILALAYLLHETDPVNQALLA